MGAQRIISFLAMLLVLAPAVPAQSTGDDKRAQEGELVVTLKAGESIEAINDRYGTETIEAIAGTNTFRVRTSRRRRTLKRLRNDDSVKKAATNSKIKRHQTAGFPHDIPDPLPPDVGESYYFSQLTQGSLLPLGIDSANALANSSEEVVVAVLDTGIDPQHPAIRSNLWSNAQELAGNGIDDDGNGYVDDVHGYDFLDDTPRIDESGRTGPVSGHGTFIAGLVALSAPNARIMPLRVLGPDGFGTSFDAAEAISYATRNGANIISMSFGALEGESPEVLRDAIISARSLGVVLVAAAGNDASETVPYPASDRENVITVGASDGDNKASFSNYGSAVDVAAPGVSLVSALPRTREDGGEEPVRYGVWSGTSFSTGIVAAAAAVLRSTQAVAEPDEITERIARNGNKLNDGATVNVGDRVNFFEAVGSIFRDAGSLDIWSTTEFVAVVPESNVSGVVVLRTIGQSEQVTAYVWVPLANTAFEVSVIDGVTEDEQPLLRVKSDYLGNIYFSASENPRTNGETTLPIDITRIAAVIVRTRDGHPVCYADVSPNAVDVRVWASVGLHPVPPEDAAFGRVWYSFDRGEFQDFAFATCALQPHTPHALVVDGEEVARAVSLYEGSIEFYFSTDAERVAKGEALPLLPSMSPVTHTRRVTLYRLDGSGNYLFPVMDGSFAGAEKWFGRPGR